MATSPDPLCELLRRIGPFPSGLGCGFVAGMFGCISYPFVASLSPEMQWGLAVALGLIAVMGTATTRGFRNKALFASGFAFTLLVTVRGLFAVARMFSPIPDSAPG